MARTSINYGKIAGTFAKMAIPAGIIGIVIMGMKADVENWQDEDDMLQTLRYEHNGLVYALEDADKVGVRYQSPGADSYEQEILYDFSLGSVTIDHEQDQFDRVMRFNELADPAILAEVKTAACVIATQQAPELLERGVDGKHWEERQTFARKAQAFASKHCS